MSGSADLTIRVQIRRELKKCLANSGNVLPELAGIRQRAVDTASQAADAVSIPGSQCMQCTGRQLAGQPCGTSRQIGSL
jgi:hypothetical protein